MNHLLTVITLLSYSAACLRLLCYRRGLANYRMHVSWWAWLLILLTGICALEILLGHSQASPGRAGIAVIFCLLVFRARGNVANILRSYS